MKKINISNEGVDIKEEIIKETLVHEPTNVPHSKKVTGSGPINSQWKILWKYTEAACSVTTFHYFQFFVVVVVVVCAE